MGFLTLRANMAGYSDCRASEVDVFVIRAIWAPRIPALNKRDVFYLMLWCRGTVLIRLAGGASFAPTSHGDVRYSTLDGERKLKSIGGTTDSDVRQ